MYEKYLIINFALFIVVALPLKAADLMFVLHIRHRWPDVWESMGKPGYIHGAKTTKMLRGFVAYGHHPLLSDDYIKRIALAQKILAPAQSILFMTFVILFIVMIFTK